MQIRSVGFISALIYTSISLLASASFFIATLGGNYSWVARIGGVAWVFLLSMIILMPVVTPRVKRKYRS